jgi:hypothetical protein
MTELAGEQKPIPVHRIFLCITTDTITEVAWGWDDQLILKPDFRSQISRQPCHSATGYVG